MSSLALGIDIGGSAVKLGLVSSDGVVLQRRQFAFKPNRDFADFVDHLCLEAEAVQREAGARARAIGLAMPGYVAVQTGIPLDGVYNVPSLAGRSLPHELRERTRLPVAVFNDGVAATLAELRLGAGRGLDRFVMMTIGTGIGGGLVVGGDMVLGTKGEPPELGAMVLDRAGPINYSGFPGTLEALASVPGLNHAYGSEGLPGATIFARAAAGDAAAAAAVDAVCRSIAQACGILINALNLQSCILGGGVSNAGAFLSDGVRRHLGDYTWPLLLANCELQLAAFLNDAGLVGAAISAAHEPEKAAAALIRSEGLAPDRQAKQ